MVADYFPVRLSLAKSAEVRAEKTDQHLSGLTPDVLLERETVKMLGGFDGGLLIVPWYG
jgi:hypothetical protein